MKHLVIIDGHHLMYRAYWAIPRTLTTNSGEQSNAVFGVAGMIMQILKTEQPDCLLFVFDAGEETFRHKEYAEYKAGRAKTPDDFYVQIPRIFEMIDAFGFQSVSDGKYEADDFAGAYACAAAKAGDRVTIVSGDRDLLQLATDRVRIAVPHKGYQQPEYFGPGEVFKKFGATPAQVPFYKGLVGDSSDNLPGVQGIGPKAAEVLLQKYHDIDNLYAHLDEVKAGWKTKLTAGREQAYFCQKMATLKCDIPLPTPLDDLELKDLQSDAVLHFFRQMDFITLTKRFQALLATPYGQAHFYSAADVFSPELSGNFEEDEGLKGQKKEKEKEQMSLL